MAISGPKIMSEFSRFRSILAGSQANPGGSRYVEIQAPDGSKAALQGQLSDVGQDDSFFVNLDGIQVHYQKCYPDGKHAVVERQLMWGLDDHSDPGLWKLQTHHRNSVVEEAGQRLLGDDSQLSLAVYPGEGGVRRGVLVETRDLTCLPLEAQQVDSLNRWNISH